ncbi:MAG: hypothetical protein PHY48_01610 [Candidatus Cloacimonetes bacterium]|nr:hypothetical protein [Candidatus Cloacimonadota bacterium]
MSKDWKGKASFQRISGMLATMHSREFERGVLPYLQIIWKDMILPNAMKGLDKKGIDLLVWKDVEPFPVVVQCKGFEVLDGEIGDSQISQCSKSIEKFVKSSVKADIYILLHNRTKNSSYFTTTIQNMLSEIVSNGKATRAELWDRHYFINKVFNILYESTLSIVTSASYMSRKNSYNLDVTPLKTIPYEVSKLKSTPNRLEKQSEKKRLTGDPLIELSELKERNLAIIIAEAGYGKTTTVLRSLDNNKQKVIFVEASRIPKHVANAKQLFIELIDKESIVNHYNYELAPIIEKMLQPVVEMVFKVPDSNLVLILDGLDESVFFHRIGGFQTIVNLFGDITIPVILTTRTEDWNFKVSDFQSAYGALATINFAKSKNFKLIELSPWDDETIAELIKRHYHKSRSSVKRGYLSEFIELVKSHQYDALYGDIPRRPLFLKMMIDTISEKGLQKQKIATLLYDWLYFKILRDINKPKTLSSEGRPKITNDNLDDDTIFRIAFKFMQIASVHMSERIKGNLVLKSTACLQDVMDQCFQKETIDVVSLVLHSILVPLPKKRPHEKVVVKFSHRIYQEFFLAYYIVDNKKSYKNLVIPQEISNMIVLIENDLNSAK